MGEVLSSCEYIDAEAMNCVLDHLKLKRPISAFPFYMLIECSGSNEGHDQEKLTQFLEHVMDSGLVCDGTVASDSNQMLVRNCSWNDTEPLLTGFFIRLRLFLGQPLSAGSYFGY